MKKEDFCKGQTVFLRENDGRLHGKTWIVEATVVSVGRRYVTVKVYNQNVRFDIEDDFRQVTEYNPRYVLYLSKEMIEEEDRRREKDLRFFRLTRESGRIPFVFSEEDLDKVLSILEKYAFLPD